MHLLNNYLVTGVLLSINISVFIVLSILAWNGTEIDGFVKAYIGFTPQAFHGGAFIVGVILGLLIITLRLNKYSYR